VAVHQDFREESCVASLHRSSIFSMKRSTRLTDSEHYHRTPQNHLMKHSIISDQLVYINGNYKTNSDKHCSCLPPYTYYLL